MLSKLLDDHPKWFSKYCYELEKSPGFFAKRIRELVSQMNRTKDVDQYNLLAEEHEAVIDFYDAALTLLKKKEDERRLKEFYEVLIHD